MANTSFTEKKLAVYITLRSGTFTDGANTKIIQDVPIQARIEKTGPPDFSKASVSIRGMKYSDIEMLSTLSFKPLYRAKNIISIYAGDTDSGLKLAFSGDITKAGADFNGAPDVTFKMECMTGYYGLTTVQSPTAVNGSQPVEKFIAQQAKTMGYTFRNDGVTSQVKNAIFNGSPLTQARQAAKQVGAELILDDGVLILSPSGGNEDSGNAVLLNKSTGLIGYPNITNEGLEVKSLYNPQYRLGGLVKVESLVPKASGVWRIIKLSHELEANNPSGGSWYSQMTTFYPSMSGAGGKI